MLSRGNPSPRQFHVLVQKSIELWNACLTWNTVRGCAYNATLIPYEYTHPVSRSGNPWYQISIQYVGQVMI